MRRLLRVFPLLSVCLSVAAGPGLARAQQPATLRISAFVPDAPTAVAQAMGTLSAVGLDVDVSITTSSTEQMRGLSTGTYDIAFTAFDNVLAWSGRDGGPEIVTVAQIAQDVTLPLYVRPEIADWEDLRGRPLAVDAVDTAFALVLRQILLAHGLDLASGDYTLVPLGAPAARLDSLVKGQTFAAILNPPTDAEGAAAGLVAFGDQHDVLPDYPGTVMAVRREWANEHRAQLVSFLRAWIAAGQFAQAERQPAAALFARAANVPVPVATGLMPASASNGALNVPGLRSVLDLRTQFGYALPMGADISAYLDPSFQRLALASK